MTVREVLEQMPEAQVNELARLLKLYPGSPWHLNNCGCCVCLHADGHNTSGWIINSEGDSEYLAHASES